MSAGPRAAGTARRERFRLHGSVGGVTVLLIFLAFGLLPIGEQLRLLVFDGYQNLWPRERRSTPAVIVAIDEASLAHHGQWPWPRSLLADLVDRIAAAQPAGIGLDLILPEADRYSPPQYARSADVPAELAQALRALPDHDARFARTIAEHRVVLGITALERVETRFPNPPTAAPIRIGAGVRLALRDFPGSLQNYAVLERAAAGRGLVNSDERDRVVRRVPLLATVNGVVVPTLALEMWRVATRVPALRVDESTAGLLQVSFGNVEVPTQTNGNFWLYASPRDPRRLVSAQAVLAGSVDPELLRGRLVLVGVTGLALVDRRVTPLRDEVSGVELHAELIEQIFDARYLTRPGYAPWLERLLLVAACGLLILWIPRLRAREALVVVGLLIAIEALIGAVAFHASSMLLDVATPALATLATFTVMIAATLEEAERQRGALRDAAARVTGELEAARRIQGGLLAAPALQFRDEPAFEVDAILEPARSVGGDFYECIKLDQRRLLFAVGDVSGKGVPAALFMALSKAILKATALRTEGDVSGIVGRAASEITLENPESMFVTLFVGILDLVTGTVDYCNAGHEPPFVGGGDKAFARFPVAEGPPLCVVEDFAYETHYHSLAAGQWLCVLSDGVTEAVNARGELFGAARVEAALASVPAGARAQEVVRRLRDAVAAFVGDAPTADDLTLLVVRWNGPASAVPVEDEETELTDVDLDAPVARLGDAVGGGHE